MVQAALGFTRLLAAAEDAALDTPAAAHLLVSDPQIDRVSGYGVPLESALSLGFCWLQCST